MSDENNRKHFCVAMFGRGSYRATTRGAKLQRTKAPQRRRVKPGSIPVHTLTEMNDGARDLRANGTDILYEIACLLFLLDFLEEYDVEFSTISTLESVISVSSDYLCINWYGSSLGVYTRVGVPRLQCFGQ